MTRLPMKLTIAALAFMLASAGALAQRQTGKPQVTPVPPPTPMVQPSSWGALLVSGDGSIPAFDNMVLGLARRLDDPAIARGNIVTVTARTASESGPSTVAGIEQAAGQLRLAPGQGCLVFLTAHGSPAGLAIVRNNETLSPRQLDRIVDAACGARATVLIVSACYSGVFADRAMHRPNRVIMTAARRDRTSFGCSAENILTVFDGCLLQALRPGLAWRDVAVRARSCVTSEERRLGVLASEPQFVAGDLVRTLTSP